MEKRAPDHKDNLNNSSLKIDVILKSSDENQSTGYVIIEKWNQKERLIRAMKMLGILWGIGLLSVLIPLAHFVLVPAFLIAGPFVAYYVYHLYEMVVGGQGTCPSCQKNFIVAKALAKWPLKDLCTSCQREVEINNMNKEI